MNLVIIIVLLVPIILSVYKIGSSKAKNVADFFLADRKMDRGDFIHTTVSYAYQVAALSLFAYWGYSYGIWTILVCIFWYWGFSLLSSLNRRGYLNNFFEISNGDTLHGFIAKKYDSRNLAIIAALASVLGLSGTAFVEVDLTSSIISNSLFHDNQITWFYILFAFFILVVLGYILWGGLKTITITNKVQLNVGFVCYNLFFLSIINKVANNGYTYSATLMFSLALLSVIYLCWSYSDIDKIIGTPSDSKNYSQTLIVVLFTYFIAALLITFLNVHIIPKDSYHTFFFEQKFNKPLSLGESMPNWLLKFLPLLSLLLANGLWQIVDVSTWQRLTSLNSEKISPINISKTIKFIGKYSSVTWFIAILFGMALHHVGLELSDPSMALQLFTRTLTVSNSPVDLFFIGLFLISMILIMLSTLDSIISVIAYTTYYDIIAKKQRTLRGARFWTIAYTFFFLFIYWLIRGRVSTLDGILYTFYSFQLALFPSIIFLLLNKKIKVIGVYLSIIIGMVGTLVPLFVNSEIITPYTMSATICLTSSVFIAYLFNVRQKKPNNAGA